MPRDRRSYGFKDLGAVGLRLRKRLAAMFAVLMRHDTHAAAGRTSLTNGPLDERQHQQKSERSQNESEGGPGPFRPARKSVLYGSQQENERLPIPASARLDRSQITICWLCDIAADISISAILASPWFRKRRTDCYGNCQKYRCSNPRHRQRVNPEATIRSAPQWHFRH